MLRPRCRLAAGAEGRSMHGGFLPQGWGQSWAHPGLRTRRRSSMACQRHSGRLPSAEGSSEAQAVEKAPSSRQITQHWKLAGRVLGFQIRSQGPDTSKQTIATLQCFAYQQEQVRPTFTSHCFARFLPSRRTSTAACKPRAAPEQNNVEARLAKHMPSKAPRSPTEPTARGSLRSAAGLRSVLPAASCTAKSANRLRLDFLHSYTSPPGLAIATDANLRALAVATHILRKNGDISHALMVTAAPCSTFLDYTQHIPQHTDWPTWG